MTPTIDTSAAVIELAVPFEDAVAGELALSLQLVTVDSLASTHASMGDWQVTLSILGSSHQVVARGPAGELVETVACAGHLPPSLRAGFARMPLHRNAVSRAGAYRFDSSVQRLAPAAFARVVAAVPTTCQAAAARIVGAFPGATYALTALACSPGDGGSLAWTTWHTYPTAGEIVTTRSTLTPPVAALTRVRGRRATRFGGSSR